jgi:hypothetical protein
MGKKEIENMTEKFGKSKEKSSELMLLFPLYRLNTGRCVFSLFQD